MVSDKKMSNAARIALVECLGLKVGERLLIVTNPEKQRMGEALFREGSKLGAESVL